MSRIADVRKKLDRLRTKIVDRFSVSTDGKVLIPEIVAEIEDILHEDDIEVRAAQWHIDIDKEAGGRYQPACKFNGSNCLCIADYPFQVTCPECKKICEERLANGNPDNWPTGEKEKEIRRRYDNSRDLDDWI